MRVGSEDHIRAHGRRFPRQLFLIFVRFFLVFLSPVVVDDQNFSSRASGSVHGFFYLRQIFFHGVKIKGIDVRRHFIGYHAAVDGNAALSRSCLIGKGDNPHFDSFYILD